MKKTVMLHKILHLDKNVQLIKKVNKKQQKAELIKKALSEKQFMALVVYG